MSFLADIFICAREQAFGSGFHGSDGPGGGHSGHAPQRPITGDQHIFCPPKPKPGLLDPLGPLAEVDFLSGFRAPRDGSGPAGRIRALQNEPGPRGMGPQDESGPRKTDQGP